MIIKFTIILFATVITVQGASTGEFGNITTTTETTTETTTKNFETTASTTGTTESTSEFSNTTDVFTGVSTTASTTNDYSSTVSSTGTPEASFRTTTDLLTTISSTASTTADGSTTTTTKTTTETTTQNFETTVSTTGATESTSEFSTTNDYSNTVSSTGTPEASVSSTTDLLTTISSTGSTASRTADSTSDSSPESTTLTSTRDGQSTTFSTTAASESSTETSPTASTRQNQTKWRSSYISTMTTIIPTTTTENPIDEIKQLYNEIKNATVHGLIQTREFIEQIFRFPITFTSNVIKNISKISFEFFEKLDKLNLKYIKFGVDISSCIELVLPGFAELPLILSKQLTECIKPEIDVVSNNLFITVRNVTTLWNIVLDLGIELDNCGTNSSCLTDLISRITAEFIEIPTTITTDLLRIQQYLDNTTILIETCAESKFSAAITNGTEAIKNVTDCARKIFS